MMERRHLARTTASKARIEGGKKTRQGQVHLGEAQQGRQGWQKLHSNMRKDYWDHFNGKVHCPEVVCKEEMVLCHRGHSSPPLVCQSRRRSRSPTPRGSLAPFPCAFVDPSQLNSHDQQPFMFSSLPQQAALDNYTDCIEDGDCQSVYIVHMFVV